MKLTITILKVEAPQPTELADFIGTRAMLLYKLGDVGQAIHL